MLSGLREWTTPKLEEIEYTAELRRLYRCEVIEADEAEAAPPVDVDTIVRQAMQSMPH